MSNSSHNNYVPFIRYQWNAKSFALDEIGQAAQEFGVFGKRIVNISIIGVARNLSEWNLMMTARRICVNAGASYEAFDSGNYPHIDRIQVPCEAVICEPIVFTFEDGSTFEVQAIDGGVKMSVNQIPGNTRDGLNHTNVNGRCLFAQLIGKELESVTVATFRMDVKYGASQYRESSEHYCVQFWATGDYGFSLLRRYDAWYRVSMVDQHHHTYEGNETATLPYSEAKKAIVPVRQIGIIEGHDGSSYFWIMPVRLAKPGEDAFQGVNEFDAEEISIEEGDVYRYLSVFLNKYFDPELSEPFRDENCGPGFEWNLEHNVYTYKIVETMLSDIREAAVSFLRNDGDQAFDEVRSRFGKDDLSERGIQTVVDFYGRFCRRMEAMMTHAPDYELISFMGP